MPGTVSSWHTRGPPAALPAALLSPSDLRGRDEPPGVAPTGLGGGGAGVGDSWGASSLGMELWGPAAITGSVTHHMAPLCAQLLGVLCPGHAAHGGCPSSQLSVILSPTVGESGLC